ncbi:MAG: hypothetical protein IKW60_01640 [Clostridia bacterium]|nr:hypothetical protein [Clostridia bacterium]
MKQKLIALCLLIGLITTSGVCAIEEDRLITAVDYFTADLYYCDAEAKMVVLKNVKSVGYADTERRRTMSQAEYTEIPISGSARLGSGEYIPLEELNAYADCGVGVIITRNKAEGIRVVALHFR